MPVPATQRRGLEDGSSILERRNGAIKHEQGEDDEAYPDDCNDDSIDVGIEHFATSFGWCHLFSFRGNRASVIAALGNVSSEWYRANESAQFTPRREHRYSRYPHNRDHFPKRFMPLGVHLFFPCYRFHSLFVSAFSSAIVVRPLLGHAEWRCECCTWSVCLVVAPCHGDNTDIFRREPVAVGQPPAVPFLTSIGSKSRILSPIFMPKHGRHKGEERTIFAPVFFPIGF